MVTPKGIRKAGIMRGHSKSYTGIAIDLFSTLSIDLNALVEAVEVNNPTAKLDQTIVESVGVVVTP